MHKRVLRFIVCVALLLGVPLSAAATVIPHDLRIADGDGDVSTLNRHLSGDLTVSLLSQLTAAYLVRYDRKNLPVPELATVVPTQANGGVSRDGRVITWHLRTDARWSDGAPFTADDVVFTVGVIKNPANNELGRDGWLLITKVDEPDKYTVVFHLSKPYAAYLPTFFGSAGANPCVLPKHLLAGEATINQSAYNALPVGIGPFRYVAWKRADRVELEANPYYWRGKPALQRITYMLVGDDATVMTMMQTGALDLWVDVPSAYFARANMLSGVQTLSQSTTSFQTLSFDTSRPMVSDVRVRRAISMAIDRHAFLDKVRHGRGLIQESMVPPIFPFAPSDIALVPFDPAGARRLLDAAGWTMQRDGLRAKSGQQLTLALSFVSGNPSAAVGIELIRAMLKDVGIGLETKPVVAARYWDTYANNGVLFHGDWDATFVSWGFATSGDMSSLFGCAQFPPAGENIYRFCDQSLDRVLRAYNLAFDLPTKRTLMGQEAQIVADRVPLVTLNITTMGWAYNDAVTGFAPGAFTPFDDMMRVDI